VWGHVGGIQSLEIEKNGISRKDSCRLSVTTNGRWQFNKMLE